MKYFILAALLATALAKPSGQNGPREADEDENFPCLSAEHTAAGKTCVEKGLAQLNQTGTAADVTGDSTFCMPSCILTEFKALDASNQLIPDALITVITASNLTDTQKTNATAIMKECLADSTQSAFTLLSQCVAEYGPQGGQQGEHPQDGHHPHPEPNLSAECVAAAKSVACLTKAFAVNKCGPACFAGRPGGNPQ